MKKAGIIFLAFILLSATAAMVRAAPGEPLCPADMDYIPAGEFLKGWDNGEPDEKPEVTAFTQSYCVDRYEYPNKQGEMPLADVSFDTAAQLCADQGKHVCNELEWERACRGPRGTIYTNTQDYKQIQCNLNSPGAQASGANPACANDYGVVDMTGNLWEWVAGTYSEENPWPLIKGGAFKKGPLFSSCYARFTQPPEAESNGVGFRCCAEPLNDNLISYAKACPADHAPFIPDDVLALKQNPEVAFILYIDPAENPFQRPAQSTGNFNTHPPRALVLFSDSRAELIRDAISGKDKWLQNPIEAQVVTSLRDDFMTWPAPGKAQTHFNHFWTCSGMRMYIFDGKTEYWLNLSGDAAEAPDPVLMDIATKVLQAQTE